MSHQTVKPAEINPGDRLAHREEIDGRISLTWDAVADVVKAGTRYRITFTNGRVESVGAGTHYTREGQS